MPRKGEEEDDHYDTSMREHNGPFAHHDFMRNKNII